MLESVRVSGQGRICASTEKLSVQVREKSRIRGKYRKSVESVRVPGKGKIRTSTEKWSVQPTGKGRIRVSTGKWQNPGDYLEKVEYVRVPKNCANEYGKG